MKKLWFIFAVLLSMITFEVFAQENKIHINLHYHLVHRSSIYSGNSLYSSNIEGLKNLATVLERSSCFRDVLTKFQAAVESEVVKSEINFAVKKSNALYPQFYISLYDYVNENSRYSSDNDWPMYAGYSKKQSARVTFYLNVPNNSFHQKVLPETFILNIDGENHDLCSEENLKLFSPENLANLIKEKTDKTLSNFELTRIINFQTTPEVESILHKIN